MSMRFSDTNYIEGMPLGSEIIPTLTNEEYPE
jgi:hypothetical protein